MADSKSDSKAVTLICTAAFRSDKNEGAVKVGQEFQTTEPRAAYLIEERKVAKRK